MTRDRLVQLLALGLAIAVTLASGSLLPRIVDRAGERFLTVQPVTPAGESTAPAPVRVQLSALREMETTAPTRKADPGRLELEFDANSREWQGAIGDDVRITYLRDGERIPLEGELVGTDGYGLRYTDVAVEGAPPVVAIGTALGAFRGLIVDYLWIKLNMMKEKGLFYEMMADADLITKLQPRFGEVWGFHGHNMAYNVSVLTNTPEERWEWVKAGIDLVRDRGLRYNPNDIVLHKELAFWFAHKLDGVADDAHLHYKRQLAREWQLVLGTPPPSHEERIAWIRRIADAPETLGELERRDPKVKELVARLAEGLSGFDRRFTFRLDAEFLMNLGQWLAVRESPYAQLLGLEAQLSLKDGDAGGRFQNRLFQAIDAAFAGALGPDAKPEDRAAAEDFLAFLRKKVLIERYNMDPRLMYEYTRDTGPLDWRHPQAHALYWARKGGQYGALRYENSEDIYKIVNNDRTEIQAMQALARSGLMAYDIFAGDNPTRLSDPRWIKVLDRYFRRLYDKHFETRGGGGDSFTALHENFMSSAVRELYRAGDLVGAQAILDELDALYGSGGVVPNAKYQADLETFVRNVTYGEYEMQPEVARSDVYATLTRGFREGLLGGNREILDAAIRFAGELTAYFQSRESNDFTNKFGEGRMRDLIGSLRTSVEDVFRGVLLDANAPLIDRLTIWNRAPENERRAVYDTTRGPLEAEFRRSPLAATLRFEQVFPEPPGMAEFRLRQAGEAAARSAPAADRGEMERK
jgi:hypothetical protein